MKNKINSLLEFMGLRKNYRGFEVVAEKYSTLTLKDTKLPVRGTKTSAGYDFIATKDLVILPNQSVKFKTDIKAYMQNDEFLFMDIRSSIGSKKDLMITNTIGVIDSDYYENIDNDGNIQIGLRNLKPSMTIGETIVFKDVFGIDRALPIVINLSEENTVIIKKGERVCQGIFMKYLPSYNCNTDTIREGGSGHTGTK